MALILVTGVAGFIGSNVARVLSSAGHDIVGSDRLRDGGKWRNLLGIPLHDLVTPEALPQWMAANAANVECVIHLGAVSNTTETDVDRITRENIRLSLDLWAWSTQYQVPFIYASSAATYGNGSLGFFDTEDLSVIRSLRPLNAYGWSKQLIDSRILSDVNAYRPRPPQWAGLKFFNVYGPGEEHKGEMRSLITKMLPIVKQGGSVKLFKSYNPKYDDGDQLRDFIYIDDVVAIIEWLLTTPSVSGIFNVGSGTARSWNDVVHIAAACLGEPPRINYVDMPVQLRSQYQYFTLAPLEKLRSAGWTRQITSLEDGISKYVAVAAR